ncbi:hypothetical protein PV328_000867 [Microctonus aethiopoides]|nr:hypothetical protein PV328_000867 [Microctonus aethiopoides]
MAEMWQSITDFYYDLILNKSDPRVNDWPMMSGPLPTIIICISYFYIVKIIGPKLMESRKPFNLRRTMIYYNLFQVIFSTWLFSEALTNGWWNDYSFRCQPVDYSNNPKAIRMAETCWWYYFSKFTEFFDTFFFVLRKKNDHISTLHVIHHGIMPMATWLGVKFTPGGHSTFLGLLNTFVHMIMYGYYLLAACGPKIQPYLWWKKYLTTLQMAQFVLLMFHSFQLFFIECDYPKAFVWIIVVLAMGSWWHTVMDFYHDIMENKSDPRVKDWPMMSGPFPTIFICIFYAYFVKVIGPKLMEKRQPFVLRRAMLYYNLFQVIASAWIFILSLKFGWWNDYSFRCEPVDFSNTPEAIRIAKGCWWYYILKYVELLDTIFFVLRKKNNQISNLHVYHHAIMPFTAWVGTKFVPDDFMVENSFGVLSRCDVIGPKLMEKRQPFVLRRFMMYYNLFQVILSALIFYRVLKYGWWNNYSLRCQPVDYSDHPMAIGMLETCWLYYMSKFTELLDTVVFVLRKKNNQVSFLHVYHHASMPIICWIGLKFVGGGHSTFFGLLNTFVHVIMYGYYFLAGLGPKMQPYLWWKKHLTLLQLIQFVLAIIHAGQLIFIECDFPKIFLLIGLPHGFILLYLFSKFYYESYNKKKVK